jgi:hypothetical protein
MELLISLGGGLVQVCKLMHRAGERERERERI